MSGFELDPRLERDTIKVTALGLCDLLMMNDRRWPWLILVPKRVAITEFYELTPLDQTMLTFETALVAKALKEATGADKINIGTLGNIVPMFHLHVVARVSGDTNWPGPVWGVEGALAYDAVEAERLSATVRDGMLAQ